MQVEIYELLDLNGNPRYVGQSRNSKKRFWWHVSAAKRGEKGRVYNWIRSLLRSGIEPTWHVLETCSEEAVDVRESAWIAKRLEEGCDLTNCTAGGGGIRGWKQPEETKRKIGDAHRGKVVSASTRVLLSQQNRGKKLSSEQIALLLSFAVGRKHSESERKANSERMRGNKRALGMKRSEATLAKMAQASRGERSALAKVTNAQAAQVRRMYADGVRQADIMRALKLDRVMVHRIVREKTYRV